MKPVIFIFCGLFAFSTAYFELTRCSIHDPECQRSYYQNLRWTYSGVGIPELGIPIIEPYEVFNVVMPILGLWNLTFVDGTIDGLGQCIVDSYEIDLATMHKRHSLHCDLITMRGQYTVTSAPVVEETCDFDVYGDGNLVINLENWHFKFDYPIKILKHEDGQIYINALFDKATYEADVLGGVTVDVVDVKLGKQDISQAIVNFVNKNWKLIMYSDLGKFINDRSVQYYYSMFDTYYEKTPVNDYLIEDLSLFLEN